MEPKLVLSFPSGTTCTTIQLLYPSIHSLLGSNEQPVFRFDVPWSKIHLAGIHARDSLNLPAASVEELQHTLLNPAIQALKITVQPTWLKKPGEITSTHTSAVIAFEDPDGSVARTLFKSKIWLLANTVGPVATDYTQFSRGYRNFRRFTSISFDQGAETPRPPPRQS
ncbi:hypothetical protein RSOL_142610, partial [Rhizoctonia solani AG-3 Rhs1AP]